MYLSPEHQDRLTQLLVHGVAMAGGDFDALAHAVLSIVQSAGGFPLVKEDGSIVRAVGGDVLVPAAGTEPGVPGERAPFVAMCQAALYVCMCVNPRVITRVIKCLSFCLSVSGA